MKRIIAIILACPALFSTGCSREVTAREVEDEFIASRMYVGEQMGEFQPYTVCARKTITENVWEITWESHLPRVAFEEEKN